MQWTHQESRTDDQAERLGDQEADIETAASGQEQRLWHKTIPQTIPRGRSLRSADEAKKDVAEKALSALVALSGAGEGNRTLVSSLGSYSSTIELHPRRPWMVIRDRPGAKGGGWLNAPRPACERRRGPAHNLAGSFLRGSDHESYAGALHPRWTSALRDRRRVEPVTDRIHCRYAQAGGQLHLGTVGARPPGDGQHGHPAPASEAPGRQSGRAGRWS